MKDIRGIYIFQDDKLIWKQIYRIIEKEMTEQLGNKYIQLPDENKTLAYLKNRNKLRSKINIDPKEELPLKLLEEDENIEIKIEEKIPNEKYPNLQKLELVNQILMKIDNLEIITLIYEEADYIVVIFPRSDDFAYEGIETYKRIIQNSNLYSSAQFGQKLIKFVVANKFQESTLEGLDIILTTCIPFGRIIDDEFQAYVGLLYENDLEVPTLTEVSKVNLPSQTKLINKGLVKKLDIRAQERIICYQFGRDSIQDIFRVEGTIYCSVDSVSDEEISLVLSNLKESIAYGLILDLEGSIENSILTEDRSAKIDLILPNNKTFNICHYSLDDIETPPILGSYQKKQLSEECFRIRIKIMIDKDHQKSIKNLKVQMRIDPTKIIASTDLIANEGKVDIIGDKVLIWRITNPGDEEELCLSGNLEIKIDESKTNEKLPLSSYIQEIKNRNGLKDSCLTQDDIFFSMPEKFLEVEFEMADHLISQIKINPNQVSIFPTRKLETNIEKSTVSKAFYIFLDEDWETSDFTHIINP